MNYLFPRYGFKPFPLGVQFYVSSVFVFLTLVARPFCSTTLERLVDVREVSDAIIKRQVMSYGDAILEVLVTRL